MNSLLALILFALLSIIKGSEGSACEIKKMDGPVIDNGNKVRETKTEASFEACEEICINDDKCNSFTYNQSGEECSFSDKKLFGNEQVVRKFTWYYSAYKVCTRKADPDYCHWIDCKKSESVSLCPVTCTVATEPHWCKFADCTNAGVMERCKDTCRNTDETCDDSIKELCEITDCSKPKAKELCPDHCNKSDPDYCKIIDCKQPKSVKHCPITCKETTEPFWCETADCRDPKVVAKCKNTCRQKDELWLQTFANKFCGNYIRPANKYEVSSQLECQKLCNKRADCVGISYSHKPGSTGYCYKCLDDIMFHDPGNWFGFYKKPDYFN